MVNLSAEFVEKLRAIFEPNDILTGPDAEPYGTDRWFAACAPSVVVFARNTSQVSRLLALCNANGVPVTARGAGTGYAGGCVPVLGGVLLSLERMNRIKEISAEDFVTVVEPGVITSHLQEAVREQGLFYPPDPASIRECSLGGNIATNAGGPHCLKYGVTRNYVLGLEVVLMDGRVLRLGGRTHKNKTGFDLAGLFVGSEGLLGVITEATLKLLPKPPARAALSAGFRNIRTAAAAVARIFASGFLPSALEIADAFTLDAARRHQPNLEVPPGDAHLLVELDGQPSSVERELVALENILLAAGATRVDATRDHVGCEKFWEIRRGFSDSLKATGLRKLNEDIVVPRGRLVEIIEFAAVLQKESGFPIACFGHAGDGNIHVNVMVGNWGERSVSARAEATLDKLFAKVIELDGAITGEHGVGLAKMRWWPKALGKEERALHQVLKRALDPQGLLNPGKFCDAGAAQTEPSDSSPG